MKEAAITKQTPSHTNVPFNISKAGAPLSERGVATLRGLRPLKAFTLNDTNVLPSIGSIRNDPFECPNDLFEHRLF